MRKLFQLLEPSHTLYAHDFGLEPSLFCSKNRVIILSNFPYLSIDNVPSNVTANLDRVAVRMPSHPIANRFIELSNLPIAAPSANVSGRPSPTSANHVLEDLGGKIPCVIDGGSSCDYGVESTVVDINRFHFPRSKFT